MTLRPHTADCITKISRARYAEGAVCERREQFINEIMCGDVDITYKGIILCILMFNYCYLKKIFSAANQISRFKRLTVRPVKNNDTETRCSANDR